MKSRVFSILLVLTMAGTSSCESDENAKPTSPDGDASKNQSDVREGFTYDRYQKRFEGKARAYFASGCFWCVEAVFESVEGVEESISGYSGGHTEKPTYESSNTGRTGHAEAVEIIYDPKKVTFGQLVDVYFGSQNITQVNGQGPDNGSQYRSILFYQNDEEKKVIEEKVAAMNKKIAPEKVASEVMEFEKFWLAEDYHQDYERLHPDHPYIRGVSIPRLKRFQAKFPELLKDEKDH